MNILEEIINSYQSMSIDKEKIVEKIDKIKSESSINNKEGKILIEPFGEIIFPYTELGSVKSPDLINYYEMIMFSYYLSSKKKYKKVADIGSNIGLHSIILKKCNYIVEAYEPDPNTSKILKSNLIKNDIDDVVINNEAVSGFNGNAEFTKINNNITGSHISGSKNKVYGEVEKFNVKVVSLKDICKKFDFIKLDIEGVEEEAILSLEKEDLKKTDIMVEIHTSDKTKKIFEHLKNKQIDSYSQKNLWKKVTSLDHMPLDYTEGSLFISLNEMKW